MVEEYKYFLMEIDMKDITQMENQRAMEFIVGKMELFIKDSLKMVSDMGMDLGCLEIKDMKGIT